MGGDWARAREADRAARVPQGPRPRQHGVRGVLRRRGGMSGRRVRRVLAKAGRPHRAVQEREGREGAGAKWRRAARRHGEELGHTVRSDVRKTSGAPKAIPATRIARPYKTDSRPGRLPTRKTRRTTFPRGHRRLPQSWGAGKPKRPNSRESGTSPCSATSFDPSKRRSAARA